MGRTCSGDNIPHEFSTRYGQVPVASVSALVERLDADAASISDAFHGCLRRMRLPVFLSRKRLGVDRIVERVGKERESVFGRGERAGITVRDWEGSSTIVDVGVRRRPSHRLDRLRIRDDQVDECCVAIAQVRARYLLPVGVYQVGVPGLHWERARRDRREMGVRVYETRT